MATKEFNEYKKLLASGMLWEFHLELSGDYSIDEDRWILIYNKLKRSKMSSENKKLNAIKEIEFRIKKAREVCSNRNNYSDPVAMVEEIDNYLFDIGDFIDDLKDDQK